MDNLWNSWKHSNTPILVVKKNGSIQPFDKTKIINGIIKACEKRPVSLTQIENIADEIEKELRDDLVKEIHSIKIGDMVMERLKPIDEVSYIRFASVYRQFKDVTNFINFLTDIGDR